MTPQRAYPTVDMSGQIFDSWTVLRFDRYSGTGPLWLCRCLCRTMRSIRRFDLLRGRYKSCGCLGIRKGWIEDGIGYIPLTQGQVTRVSPHRVKELCRWNWCAVLLNGKYYAYRAGPRDQGKCTSIHMARQILAMDQSDKREADHSDGNSLNNVDENLSAVTKYQNMLNKPVRRDSGTGVKGVRKHKVCGVDTGRFQVRISYLGVNMHLGLCDTLEEGRAIYAEASRRLHGKFGRTE